MGYVDKALIYVALFRISILVAIGVSLATFIDVITLIYMQTFLTVKKTLKIIQNFQ